MDPKSDDHYRVVRQYPHGENGVITEVLEENLSLDAANDCVRANPPVSSDEEIVILDQEKRGLEAMVSITRGN